jgi:hypothetical protein
VRAGFFVAIQGTIGLLGLLSILFSVVLVLESLGKEELLVEQRKEEKVCQGIGSRRQLGTVGCAGFFASQLVITYLVKGFQVIGN